ncbi:hypothetical protein AB3S75_009990 [Citrus x aurantiifolia]
MYHLGSSPVHEVDQALHSRDELLLQLKKNLATAANRMKQIADKGRRDVEFKQGDMVLLKLQPYRQTSVFKRAHQKLACRYFGPYLVLRKVGAVAYELQLPENARIHPVFHVSLLKKAVGDFLSNGVNLPPMDDEGSVIMDPEAILDTRWVKRGGKVIEQNLVRWKKIPAEDATWEDATMMRQQFPHQTLEDKGILRGGGNDRKQVHEPRRSGRMPKPNHKYIT